MSIANTVINRSPTHPGEMLREDFLPDYDLTVSGLAEAIGVSRQSVTMNTQMFNPPHPGEIIKELCLVPLGLSVTEAAEALGVSRKIANRSRGSNLAVEFEALPWPDQCDHAYLSHFSTSIRTCRMRMISTTSVCR